MDVRTLEEIYGSMDRDFQQWKPWFKDLSQAYDPNRQRFDSDSTNKHERYNESIIDPSVTMVVRTASGGLQSGVTNPAVPWIQLATPDEDLNQYLSVKQWLQDCSNAILKALSRSNFYNFTPMMYKDFLIYSTMNGRMEEDFTTDIRFYHQPMGTYRIANNDRYAVDKWGREVLMSAYQMAEKYGKENLPTNVIQALNNHDFKATFKVRQIIMPRQSYDSDKLDKKNRPFASFEWLVGCQEDKSILSEGGYTNYPILTSRWEQVGNDCYGSHAPGMMALGSARGLQKSAINKFRGQDMMLDPPLSIPISMQNKNQAFMPGARYFTNGQEKVESASNINYPINYALEEIQDTRQLLKSAFFNDLFLAISNLDKTGRTATEIAERKEEKLLMIGPVLSRLNEEFLDPVVSQSFHYLSKHGKLPPAPQELHGMPLNIEYISMLHQAQKLVAMTSIEKSVSFVGNLAGVYPDIIDNIDADKTAQQYFEIAGLDPNLIPDEETIKQERAQRAQQQSAQQNAQMAQPANQAAQAAQTLANTDSNGQNMLQLMQERLGAAVNG